MAGNLAFLYGSLIFELRQRRLEENSYLKRLSFASSIFYNGEILPPPQSILVQSDSSRKWAGVLNMIIYVGYINIIAYQYKCSMLFNILQNRAVKSNEQVPE